MLELGKTYFEAEDYAHAADWFARISDSDDRAREANFYLGLSAYHLGQNDRAKKAFLAVLSQFPLPEIYNNLGVLEYLTRDSAALTDFRKAMQSDPQDQDYRFNLALALARALDVSGAVQQLRELLKLNPGDDEARDLLATLAPRSAAPATTRPQTATAAEQMPEPRIKSDYNETPFDQLALEIQNASELRLAHSDPETHAQFYVDRGRQMLAQGFQPQAERDFRQATALDPKSLGAHSGLARTLEKTNPSEARKEAETALRLGTSVEALLVLGRLDLEENKLDAASQNVQRALEIAPQDSAVLDLQRMIRQRQEAKGSEQ
jgi:tetratricopeptide (TPR) repeat protein